MKTYQKALSLLLVILMLLSTACTASVNKEVNKGEVGKAVDEKNYDKTLRISVGTAAILADNSYLDNYFFKHIQEKFNVEVEPYSSSADFDTITNTWIVTGDMPDVMTYGNNLGALLDYADQGLLAALPKGWEERYPNLYKDFSSTQMQDYCKTDDKTFILPRVVMSTNYDLPFKNTPQLNHNTIYFRADWAKELGFDIGYMTDWDTLKEYILAAKKANLEDATNIYGIATSANQLIDQFVRTEEPYYNEIYLKDGKYVLGASQKGVIRGIKRFKEFYDEELIAPDFYSMKTTDARNLYYMGSAAVLMDNGHQGTLANIGNGLVDNNKNVSDISASGVTNVLAEDGKYHFYWNSSYWRTVVFSPKLEKEPDKFERILDILDYLATVDGVLTLRLGEKGVNWDYDEKGKPRIIEKYDYNTNNGTGLWYHLASSSMDAVSYGFDPSRPQWSIDQSVSQQLAKEEHASKDIPTYQSTLAFSQNNGENKKLFSSISWSDEILRIVMAGNVDVEQEWNKFVTDNTKLWKPLLDEMNNAK